MKTFLFDIIPKIQRFSEKLDNLTVLTNKHWVVIDEVLNKKVVYIFREKNSQLLIAENGRIEKATWEYLGNNSLLIDKGDGSYLFKHGFVDDTVLALKVDGSDEYALLVNESKFDNQLNSLNAILEFLDDKYSSERNQKKLTIPQQKNIVITEIVSENHQPVKLFCSSDYPELDKNLEIIKELIQTIEKEYVDEILISFCRNHSIHTRFIEANQAFTKMVVNGELPVELIEKLFLENRENNRFLVDLEGYIRESILN